MDSLYWLGGSMRSSRFFLIPGLAGLWLFSGATFWAVKAQSNELAQEANELAQEANELAQECNQLAEAVNQNAQIMMAFEAEINDFAQNASAAETLEEIKSAAKQYVDAVGDVTDGLNGLATDLDELSLNDEQLSTYRDQYVVVVSGFNEALSSVAAAMTGVAELESEEQLPERIGTVQTETETAVAQIDELSAQESTIVTGVNEHCGIEEES